MLESIEQARAILMIQGLRVALRKAYTHLGLMSFNKSPENDIIPYLLRIAHERPYGSFIDIGAHKGEVAVRLSPVVQRCLAIEPLPRNADALRNSTSMHHNCQVVEYALGQKRQEATLFLSKSDDGNSTSRQPGLVEGPKVRMTTLDELLEEIPLPTPYLVKADVQGNELSVFRGAEQTLSKQCTIVSEFWPWGLRCSGGSAFEYLDYMYSHGYEARNLMGRKISRERIKIYSKMAEVKKLIATDVIFTKRD